MTRSEITGIVLFTLVLLALGVWVGLAMRTGPGRPVAPAAGWPRTTTVEVWTDLDIGQPADQTALGRFAR